MTHLNLSIRANGAHTDETIDVAARVAAIEERYQAQRARLTRNVGRAELLGLWPVAAFGLVAIANGLFWLFQ